MAGAVGSPHGVHCAGADHGSWRCMGHGAGSNMPNKYLHSDRARDRRNARRRDENNMPTISG
eukprot:2771438-Lingulodinium_polyedra.AAC.1